MNRLLKKYQLDAVDVAFVLLLTAVGLGIRMTLRTVTTVDWTTYWDPWITILKEQGFKAMATDF